jgi:hypothetical protein
MSAVREQEPADRYGLDFLRRDELARLSDLAASYWKSISLAADRGDVLTVAVHCKQVALVTREAFALVKTLAPQEQTRDSSNKEGPRSGEYRAAQDQHERRTASHVEDRS